MESILSVAVLGLGAVLCWVAGWLLLSVVASKSSEQSLLFWLASLAMAVLAWVDPTFSLIFLYNLLMLAMAVWAIVKAEETWRRVSAGVSLLAFGMSYVLAWSIIIGIISTIIGWFQG